MVHRLRYGLQSTIDLHAPPEVRIASSCGRALGVADPVNAVIRALQKPLGFPSLHLAATPGDRVVVALDPEVPEPAAIVTGLVEVLQRGGVEPSDVTVLFGCSGETASIPSFPLPVEVLRHEDHLGVSPADWLREVQVAYHNPRDRSELAYLATTRDGIPIYLNRLLVDADMVVPVSPVRLAGAPGYLGVFGSLLPLFSDDETALRYRCMAARVSEVKPKQLQSECDEVAWLLGSMLAVQVVAGTGGAMQSVLAGAPADLDPCAQKTAAETWAYATPFEASLVIATVAGGPNQQTWASISRALFAATQAAGASSDIVLCTELTAVPPPTHDFSGPYSTRAEGGEGRRSHRKEASRLLSQRGPVQELLEFVPGHSRVFLLSGLSPDVVEELGWGHIATADEVQRLAERHGTWILLEDAQYLSVIRDERT
jgi:hypothetical protein